MTDRFDEKARDMRTRAEYLTWMACRDRDGKPLSSEQIRETLDAAALRDTWNEAIEAAENAHMDVTERLGGGPAAHMAANNAIRALKAGGGVK